MLLVKANLIASKLSSYFVSVLGLLLIAVDLNNSV